MCFFLLNQKKCERSFLRHFFSLRGRWQFAKYSENFLYADIDFLASMRDARNHGNHPDAAKTCVWGCQRGIELLNYNQIEITKYVKLAAVTTHVTAFPSARICYLTFWHAQVLKFSSAHCTRAKKSGRVGGNLQNLTRNSRALFPRGFHAWRSGRSSKLTRLYDLKVIQLFRLPIGNAPLQCLNNRLWVKKLCNCNFHSTRDVNLLRAVNVQIVTLLLAFCDTKK